MMQTVGETEKLEIPEHRAILGLLQRDEFWDKTVKVKTNKMIAITIIIIRYYIFPRLIHSSPLFMRFIIISMLQMRQL